jgi:tetratricopeptide (TPR) repeat protein/transcriptional regulator with XRE-family HTH domain
MKAYAIRLRHERETRLWSQREVAEKLGTTAPNISRWERGITFPGPYFCQKLCELYQKSPQALGFLPEETEHSHELALVPTGEERLALSSVPCVSFPLWNVPVRRNPFFTGREEVLMCLYDTLRSEKTAALTQAITGLGGIGKTQTAVEYAYRFRDDYQAVFWVRAETPDTLITDVVHMAELLHLPEHNEQNQDHIVAAVRRWLSDHAGWLLIMDNVEDVSRMQEFAPARVGGHILLTTRSQSTGTFARCIVLKQMAAHEGTLFLLRRAKLIDLSARLEDTPVRARNTAHAISQLLDGLPLALDQAGAYIEETGGGLADYLGRYQAQRTALLDLRGNAHSDHPHSVTATVSLSFARVEQASPIAADLLRLCAFLHPDGIPEEIITEGSAVPGLPLQPLAVDRLIKFDLAIAELRKYSFLSRNMDTKTLIIHRLVQTVLKGKMNEEMRRLWAEWAMLAVNAAFPHAEYSTWPQCERLLSQALAAVQIIKQYQITREEAGRLLHEVASYLRDHAHYAEAEPLFQRALQIREQQLGPEHPETAYPLNGLANLYRDQGKYAEAEPLYQRALRIREQQLGPEHPLVAYPLNNLAILYREQGKYAEAEPLYQRALQIREQQLGPEHPLVASSLNGLAILYSEQGEYAEAEQLYQRALQIREQQLGPEHSLVATSLNNLALLFSKQGKYTEAEPLYQRALSIWKQQVGPEHPLVAHPLNGLAILYYEQGKYTEAEPLYQQALQIREQRLGPEHPETADTLYDLARLREAQGNYKEARAWYIRALAIDEQRLGTHHPRTTEIREHMIALLHEMGQDNE